MANVEDIYQDFNKDFSKQHDSLAGASVQELVELSKQYQQTYAHKYGLDAEVRQIDPDVVTELLNLAENQKIQIFMRHGEQEKSPTVKEELDPGKQKILMMQKSENMDNPITASSAIESISTIMVMKYLADNSDAFLVETSANMRARLPAEATAKLLLTKAGNNELWDCINYPDSSVDELLPKLSGGNLPWPSSPEDKDAISLVNEIAGAETYESIHAGIDAALKRDDANRVIVTHTQQIAEACGENIRLQNYGFFVAGKGLSKVYENGIYSATAPKLKYEYQAQAAALAAAPKPLVIAKAAAPAEESAQPSSQENTNKKRFG